LIYLLRSQKNDSFDPGGSAAGDGESYSGCTYVIRHIHNAENILIAESKINGFKGATNYSISKKSYVLKNQGIVNPI
jgi:hypothetical protein